MIEVCQTDTFAQWLSGLRDNRARARIDMRIARVTNGNFGDVKPIGEGVSELRVNYGPGYRIYFTTHGPRIVFLLIGGDKRSQDKDIAAAKKLAAELKE